MTSGYAITIKGFLPVVAADVESIIVAGRLVGVLHRSAPPESVEASTLAGKAYLSLQERSVEFKLVTRREPKALTP